MSTFIKNNKSIFTRTITTTVNNNNNNKILKYLINLMTMKSPSSTSFSSRNYQTSSFFDNIINSNKNTNKNSKDSKNIDDNKNNNKDSKPDKTKSEATIFINDNNEDQKFLKEDPIISQLINMIMKDGKKATATKYVLDAALEIRKQTNNEDPYKVIKTAIEIASPLVDLISKKVTGTKSAQIPTALNPRQQRNRGIKWILDASERRNHKQFSVRLALEILSVINNTSPAVKKKEQLHSSAIQNRSSLPIKW
nr:9945_t:CDS:2 [Entrophospora candida]